MGPYLQSVGALIGQLILSGFLGARTACFLPVAKRSASSAHTFEGWIVGTQCSRCSALDCMVLDR